jgi:inositol oxygenase
MAMNATNTKVYRNYSDTNDNVRNSYRSARMNQTHKFAINMRKKYNEHEKIPLNIWDAINKLDNFVDMSDPDINVPNLYHLLQTAEAIRKDGLPEWFQVVGLIHDLGKIMFIWGDDESGTSATTQWGVVGDTFLTGCKIPDTVIYPEFNSLNPDMSNPLYNTDLGIYSGGCGLENVICSWGHDEYIYRVLLDNNIGLDQKYNKAGDHLSAVFPAEALYIIRYHSLYLLHDAGEYRHLMNEMDNKMLPLVKQFNKYDLYTKEDINTEEFKDYVTNLKPYYEGLVKKYLGETIYF